MNKQYCKLHPKIELAEVCERSWCPRCTDELAWKRKRAPA